MDENQGSSREDRIARAAQKLVLLAEAAAAAEQA